MVIMMVAGSYQLETNAYTSMPIHMPARSALAVNWGQVFGGFLLGGLITILVIYGVVPALAEAGAVKIRKRFVKGLSR